MKSLLNWQNGGGMTIQRNWDDLCWTWDDVALCERRRSPLSQSTGKLRRVGAPHGWVGGQGATHCVRLTGGPWVNTANSVAARRPRQHSEATHADHQSDKRPSRLHSNSVFNVLVPYGTETGQWVVRFYCPRPPFGKDFLEWCQTSCYSSPTIYLCLWNSWCHDMRRHEISLNTERVRRPPWWWF